MFKKRNLVLFVVLIVALSMVFIGPSFAAKKSFFAIATGGTGGTYYPPGGGFWLRHCPTNSPMLLLPPSRVTRLSRTATL